MRGYWDRSDLNGTALIRRPGAGGVDDIWLRTGDLASCREDGQLVFHGRADRQVKLRGYRVELDEVEDVLVSDESVEEAAAFPIRLSDTISIIGAAVRTRPGAETSQADLLRHAAAKLPAYAVPERVEIVEAFPRTSSGKIDWKSLGLAAEEKSKSEGTAHAAGN